MAEFLLIPKKLIRRLPQLQKTAWWLEGQFFRALAALMAALPPRFCSSLLGLLFGLMGRYSDKARKARVNLAIAFPEQTVAERERTIMAIFNSLGRASGELFSAPKIWCDRDRTLEFVTHPLTLPILTAAKPVVFVTAHVGAWQLTNFLAPRFGLKATTVYAPEPNPIIHDLFFRLRAGLMADFIPSDGSVRKLLKELNRGNSVGLAVDTRLEGGEMVPFFGVAAPTNSVAARLALRSNCALVATRCERLPGGKFRITAAAPIVPRNPGASTDEQALDMTEQVNQTFEAWITDTPGEWICLKRRWPKGAEAARANSSN